MAEKKLAENVPLWSFNYKVGPAPKQGIVESRTADLAYRVAERWCQKNGHRGPLGQVQPMILATEAIFFEKTAEPEAFALADEIQATTGAREG